MFRMFRCKETDRMDVRVHLSGPFVLKESHQIIQCIRHFFILSKPTGYLLAHADSIEHRPPHIKTKPMSMSLVGSATAPAIHQ